VKILQKVLGGLLFLTHTVDCQQSGLIVVSCSTPSDQRSRTPCLRNWF